MNAPPSLSSIEAAFRERFARWKIELPAEVVNARGRGVIEKAGWSIQFLFGADERGEYLDYYASHRMTDDSHCRIYASGEIEELESYWGVYRFDPEIPGDKERADAEFKAFNRSVSEILAEKGFGPTTINSALRACVVDD